MRRSTGRNFAWYARRRHGDDDEAVSVLRTASPHVGRALRVLRQAVAAAARGRVAAAAAGRSLGASAPRRASTSEDDLRRRAGGDPGDAAASAAGRPGAAAAAAAAARAGAAGPTGPAADGRAR